MSERSASLFVLVGVVIFLIGVGFIYWPASLVIGGGFVAAVGLLSNTEPKSETPKS